MSNRNVMPQEIMPTLLSHGTLESKDLEKSRRFYEGILGLKVVKTGPISLWIRLGDGECNIVVLGFGEKAQAMPTMNFHWGLDVPSLAAVDAQYERLTRLKDEYGIGEITKPKDAHGSYSFYFEDCDGNWWEFQYVPEGIYDEIFGGKDLEGRGVWNTRPSKSVISNES